MNISDLLKPVKKKAKRKKGVSFYGIPTAIVQSGTGEDTIAAGAGITGIAAEVSEELDVAEDTLKQRILIGNGFYLNKLPKLSTDEKKSSKRKRKTIVNFELLRLLEDKSYGFFSIMQNADGGFEWLLKVFDGKIHSVFLLKEENAFNPNIISDWIVSVISNRPFYNE